LIKEVKHRAPSNNESPTITIITVCLNSAPTIENTIRSVLRQKEPHVEYLVIDGASTDGTMDVLEKYSSEIDLVISERDKGIYDAMNKGISLSHGEYLLFLNNDMVLKPECVCRMLDVLKEHPDAFAVDARHLSPDGGEVQHNATVLTRGSWFSNVIPGFTVKYNGPADHTVRVPWVCGGCFLVVAEKFWQV